MSNINQILNCNAELLAQQKENLINEITCGENGNYFKVIDLECGTGKTLTAEEALAKMIRETDKSAILVRLTKKDCRESAQRINEMCKNKFAFVFNNDLNKWEKQNLLPKLPDYRVICITHQKYVDLSRNDRRAFIKGRSILVVNEFPSDVIPMKLDMEYIGFYKALFNSDPILSDMFSKIVKELEDCLLSREDVNRNLVKIAKPRIKKDIAEFIRLVKANILEEQLQSYLRNRDLLSTHANEVKQATIQSLCKQIANIQQFYGRVCVFANNAIYTSDTRYDRWFLQNNILLDASGCLQSAYELAPDTYHLANFEPVLDHHQWTMYHIVANTTTSGKARITNFPEVVNNILSQNDDCLLVCKKDELPLFQCRHKCYFGNITGSNEFRDLKNVVIAHTPNLDDVNYILKYLHYNREEINNKTLMSKGLGRGLTQTKRVGG